MEEAGKYYYTISETAKIKGISENEILFGIQSGKIPVKRFGISVKIPASCLFEETDEESASRGEELFKKLRPEFIKILEDAPEYGTCGLVITLHEGKIAKKERIYQKTEIEEKQ